MVVVPETPSGRAQQTHRSSAMFSAFEVEFSSSQSFMLNNKNLPACISALPEWWEGVLIFPSIKYTTALLIEEEKVPTVSGAVAMCLPPRFTACWHRNPSGLFWSCHWLQMNVPACPWEQQKEISYWVDGLQPRRGLVVGHCTRARFSCCLLH